MKDATSCVRMRDGRTAPVRRFLWAPSPRQSIQVARVADELYFTGRGIADLLEVTQQNVSVHLADLEISGVHIEEERLPITQREGQRAVTRQLKHYPFGLVSAIALRAKHYAALNQLTTLAKQEGLEKGEHKFAPIKERDFAVLLTGALQGLTEVLQQYRIGPYFVDFYLPREGLVVEYDESHHEKPARQTLDQARQVFISETLPAKFIRVKQGTEIAGLNAVLRHVVPCREGQS